MYIYIVTLKVPSDNTLNMDNRLSALMSHNNVAQTQYFKIINKKWKMKSEKIVTLTSGLDS